MHILTSNEQYICDTLITDPLYCSDEISADPQEYMQPIAEFLKRNEITDAEKVRLADQLIYKFFCDIKNKVCEEDKRDESILADAEEELHLSYKLGMSLGVRA